jgi:hypothetical protein
VIDYRSVNFKNLRKALLMRLSEIFYAYNCKRRERQKSNFYIFDFLREEDDEDEEELVNSLNINRKTA